MAPFVLSAYFASASLAFCALVASIANCFGLGFLTGTGLPNFLTSVRDGVDASGAFNCALSAAESASASAFSAALTELELRSTFAETTIEDDDPSFKSDEDVANAGSIPESRKDERKSADVADLPADSTTDEKMEVDDSSFESDDAKRRDCCDRHTDEEE